MVRYIHAIFLPSSVPTILPISNILQHPLTHTMDPIESPNASHLCGMPFLNHHSSSPHIPRPFPPGHCFQPAHISHHLILRPRPIPSYPLRSVPLLPINAIDRERIFLSSNSRRSSLGPAPYLREEMCHVDTLAAHFDHPGVF